MPRKTIGKAFKISKRDAQGYGYAKARGKRMTPNAGVTAIAAVNGRGSYSARQAMSGRSRSRRLSHARNTTRGQMTATDRAAFAKRMREARAGSRHRPNRPAKKRSASRRKRSPGSTPGAKRSPKMKARRRKTATKHSGLRRRSPRRKRRGSAKTTRRAAPKRKRSRRRKHTPNRAAAPKRRKRRKVGAAKKTRRTRARKAAPKKRRKRARKAGTHRRKRRKVGAAKKTTRRRRKKHAANRKHRRNRRRKHTSNRKHRRNRRRRHTSNRKHRRNRRRRHASNRKRGSSRRRHRSNKRRGHRRNSRKAFRRNAGVMDTLKLAAKVGLIALAGIAAHRVVTKLFSDLVLAKVIGQPATTPPAVAGLEVLQPYQHMIASGVAAIAGSLVVNFAVKDSETKSYLIGGMFGSFFLGMFVDLLAKFGGSGGATVASYLSGYSDSTAAALGASIMPRYYPVNGMGEYFESGMSGLGEYFESGMSGLGNYGGNPDLYQAAAGFGAMPPANVQHVDPSSDLDRELTLAEAAAGVGAASYEAAAGMGLGEYMGGGMKSLPATSTWVPGMSRPDIWAPVTAVDKRQAATASTPAGILQTGGGQGVFG